MASEHELRQFEAEVEVESGRPTPRTARFISAYQTAFHWPDQTDTELARQASSAITSKAVLTEVVDPSAGPDPDFAARPVATFVRFRGEVNLGAGVLVPATFVTDIAVRPTHKRQGLLRRMMVLNLEQEVQAGVPVALLNASGGGIYGRFGFQNIYDDSRVHVRPKPTFHLTDAASRTITGRVEAVSIGWLLKNVGPFYRKFMRTYRMAATRYPAYYADLFHGAFGDRPSTAFQSAVHLDQAGEITGYVIYRVAAREFPTPGDLLLADLSALTPDAELALWDYLAGVELVEKIVYEYMPEDSALPLALEDPRTVKVVEGGVDVLWARVLDAPSLLKSRPYSEVARRCGLEARFNVEDPLGYTEGSYAIRLSSSTPAVSVERAALRPDLPAVSVRALAALIFGYRKPQELAAAGMITSGAPEVLAGWETLFAPVGPARFLSEF